MVIQENTVQPRETSPRFSPFVIFSQFTRGKFFPELVRDACPGNISLCKCEYPLNCCFFFSVAFLQGKQQNYFLKYFFCIFIIHLVSYAVLAGASFVILKMYICP